MIQGRQRQRAGESRRAIERDPSGSSLGFVLGNSGNSEDGKKCALYTRLTASRVVPLLERMRPAAAPSSADRDGIDSESERDIRIGRRTLDARLIAHDLIGLAKRSQPGRIR